jgi:hypothetical protein
VTGHHHLAEIFELAHWGLKKFLPMSAIALSLAEKPTSAAPERNAPTATAVRHRSLPSHSAASAERLRTPNLA